MKTRRSVADVADVLGCEAFLEHGLYRLVDRYTQRTVCTGRRGHVLEFCDEELTARAIDVLEAPCLTDFGWSVKSEILRWLASALAPRAAYDMLKALEDMAPAGAL